MGESAAPVVVAFPLRGEGWVAVASPADRIPSHGTDLLGQRYAFDFLRTDQRRGGHYHPAGWVRTLLAGVPIPECYAYAPDPLTARGVPCAFASYEVLRGDAWAPVKAGIPGKAERMRVMDPEP
jgi:hypothetical protein